MRIVLASHNAAHVGGVETYIETIVPALAAAGHAVAVWHEHGERAPRADASTVVRWFHQAESDSIASVAEWCPDLIFTHGLRSQALEARLMALAPAITFAHSYLGTCISGNKMHAFPSAVACTRRFGPACAALYYPRRCGGLNPATAVEMYRRQAARLRLLGAYRRILVASRHMEEEYARHGFGSKTRVVRLPVLPQERVALALRPAAPPWRLLYLGRLEWTKGADIAVDAAASASRSTGVPVHLVIAGAGSMDRALRRRAADAARAHAGVTFQFAGAAAPEARSALLEDSHLLLVPSRWPEPFALVGNEAGTFGVPSLAFGSGGIPDWLSDGLNGAVVHGRPRAAAFAAALARLLSDPASIATMGTAARQSASRFTVDAHLQALEAVFRDVTVSTEGSRA